MTVHDFDKSFADAHEDEARIDAYFQRHYRIAPVPRARERQGIDRIWTCRKYGRVWTVEYKADRRAADTGNFFIETKSVDTADKDGWALTCQAQLLVEYVPDRQRIYLLDVCTLKIALPGWMETHPRTEAVNNGYSTRGFLVPMEEVVQACCLRTFELMGPTEIASPVTQTVLAGVHGPIRDDEIPM